VAYLEGRVAAFRPVRRKRSAKRGSERGGAGFSNPGQWLPPSWSTRTRVY